MIRNSSIGLIEAWSSFQLNILTKPLIISFLTENINNDTILMIEGVFAESFQHCKNFKLYHKSYFGLKNFVDGLDKVEMESLGIIILKLKEILNNLLTNENLLRTNFQVFSGVSHIFAEIIENFIYMLFLVTSY